VENCQIVLGEDVELRIAPTGILQGCRIFRRGSTVVAGRKTDELPEGTLPTETGSHRTDPSPESYPAAKALGRSARDGSRIGDEPPSDRNDLLHEVTAEVDQMLSVRQAAEMMSVHTGTLRRWIQAGRLRATKPGRHWRIPERSLRELVEKGSGEPEPRAR
jgi:excisionase family DNA binding protein